MWRLTLSKQYILQKLEKILFGLLIFALPFGTRKFIFGELAGNDFFSMFIYFSDILLTLLLLVWIMRGGFEEFIKKRGKILIWATIFIFILLLSLLANFNFLSIYHFIRILAGVSLIVYVSSSYRIHNFNLLLNLFIASIVIQSIIGIAQFNFQNDLGFKYFGEMSLSPDIAGTAKIDLATGKFIRAYGTLPHPNILALFLFTGYVLLIYKIFFVKKTLLDYFYLVLIVSALFFTFSRSAFLVFFIFLLLFLFYLFKYHREKLKQNLLFFLLLLFIIFFLSVTYLPFLLKRADIKSDTALKLRNFYNATAVQMIKSNLLTGVGPGNFVKEINNYLIANEKIKNVWELQPVHNVFLLIFAENGVFAFFIFATVLFSMIFNLAKKSLNRIGKINLLFIFRSLIFCFIVLMFFDHYFWTNWQAFLLLCITLGINCELLNS